MTTHAKISYLKSAFRLLGYGLGAGASINLDAPWLVWAFGVLMAAEIIGIVEEFGE